ncbi:hypothetical protein [Granulicella arctica]|uniref:Uncharacterized protein n=1 Tax=Granulicella arctica TaxID=940613 RepID=A0A7Y9TI79_9BACT|nr:hypothetical protein [Granulicella arctica]NYF81309.1 hypothetical protein [Granulicella arctica]
MALPGLKSEWMKGMNFSIKRIRGGLLYREDDHEYLVSAVEGNGYSIVVEQMGEGDTNLGRLPDQERLRIARNIKLLLLANAIDAEVILEHRVFIE